jgi:glyoxylase-like metal-dependent hydrolase (beta-lactamase superfamily II)
VARSFWRVWLERFAPSGFRVTLPSTVSVTSTQPGRTAIPDTLPPPSVQGRPGGFQGTFTVSAFKVGQCELPGPLVFRSSAADDWYLLYFYMIVIRGLGKTLIVNPGLPDDLSEMNQVWTELAGKRCRVRRTEDERTEGVLERNGVSPDSVDFILLTPFKVYAIGNLDLFPRATVCFSQRGWTEQYLARRYPSPEPDPLAVPDPIFDRLQQGAPNPLRLLRDEDEILPGIRAFHVGVRDHSSMAYVVNTAKGAVIMSDCCFKYENVEGPQPTGVAQSLQGCLNAYARMRAEGEVVVPIYDPALLERFPGGRIG